MANEKQMMSIRATTSERISDLVIKNGQLIFIYDVGRIALDYNGKRTFYNQIIELDAEQDRLNLTDPTNGKYYFVIETMEFWRYYNGWNLLTKSNDDVVVIADEFPALGQKKTLYVNSTENNEHISIWSDEKQDYTVVADKTHTISVSDIEALFS